MPNLTHDPILNAFETCLQRCQQSDQVTGSVQGPPTRREEAVVAIVVIDRSRHSAARLWNVMCLAANGLRRSTACAQSRVLECPFSMLSNRGRVAPLRLFCAKCLSTTVIDGLFRWKMLNLDRSPAPGGSLHRSSKPNTHAVHYKHTIRKKVNALTVATGKNEAIS